MTEDRRRVDMDVEGWETVIVSTEAELREACARGNVRIVTTPDFDGQLSAPIDFGPNVVIVGRNPGGWIDAPPPDWPLPT